MAVSSSYSIASLVLDTEVRRFRPHCSPSLPSSEEMTSSKSVPSPRRLIDMISLFNSNTDIPVPSKATREGSLWDLKRKNTEEDMVVHVKDGDMGEISPMCCSQTLSQPEMKLSYT